SHGWGCCDCGTAHPVRENCRTVLVLVRRDRAYRASHCVSCRTPGDQGASVYRAPAAQFRRRVLSFLTATRRVALEVARNVQRLGAAGSGPKRDDDGWEPIDLGEARLHLVDQFVLGYEQKAPAEPLRQAARQIPLVLDAAGDLPFDRVERVGPDVVDEG